jgi:hypothetical protein
MRGNSHVRFLGGDGPAMACPYPPNCVSDAKGGSAAWSGHEPFMAASHHRAAFFVL